MSLIAVDNVLKVLFGIDTNCYDVGRTKCEVYTHLILDKEIFAFGALSDIRNMMNFLVSIRAEDWLSYTKRESLRTKSWFIVLEHSIKNQCIMSTFDSMDHDSW